MATEHSERRRLPYTPRQMYDLVMDVESYPDFIPWIQRVRKRGEGNRFEADTVVAFKVFRERYTSRIEAVPPGGDGPARIDVKAIDGPFRKLVTVYIFHDAPEGCEMELNVEFEFSNRLLQRAAGAAFGLAMSRVTRAFEERAAQLYGATEGAAAAT